MIQFKATIKKFTEMGEKTGWTYIEIPLTIAEKLKPNSKKSFRVKGKLDDYAFEKASLFPIGEGNYIMALNASIRKHLKKQKGDIIKVQMQEDKKEPRLSDILLECLKEDPKAIKFFKALPKGHQRYFSNWVESAKTESTKAKRIAQAINALALGLGFGEMIRMNKKNKNV